MDEIEQEALNGFAAVPSYFERFVPGQEPVLIAVEYCESCNHWHAPEDECPVMPV